MTHLSPSDEMLADIIKKRVEAAAKDETPYGRQTYVARRFVLHAVARDYANQFVRTDAIMRGRFLNACGFADGEAA